MWRFGVTMMAVILAIGCTRDVARIETRKLPQQNPTTYEFDYTLDSLHERAMNIFSIERQVEEPIFGRPSSLPVPAILSVEESKNAVFGKGLLSRPGNEGDIYLHSFHMPLWESPVYRGAHRGLHFFAEFHLHLLPVTDRRTRVSVTAMNTGVVNGQRFGLGHGGPGWYSLHVKVSPTTVEEYVVLRYLGRALGVQDMPNVVLPAE